jgi:hypothetical protein
MTSLRWTRPHRLKLHGPRHRHPDDPVATTADDAWRELTGIHARRIKQETQIGARVLFPRRYFTKLKPVKPRLDAVLAELERPERPRDLDVLKELVRALVIWNDLTDHDEHLLEKWDGWAHARALVDLWAGSRGLAFCLEVLSSPASFTTSGDFGDGTFDLTLEPPTDDDGWMLYGGLSKVSDPLWWAARLWVSSLPDDAFARERDAAKALLSRWSDGSDTSWHIRSRIAYVLSRDPSIAEALKAELLQHEDPPGNRDYAVWLYPSLAGAESVLALMSHVYPQRVRKAHNLSFDIVDAYDTSAASILQRMIGLSAKQYETRERAALEFVERATSSATPTPAKTAAKKTATTTAAKKTATKKPAVKKTAAKKTAAKKTAKTATRR